MASICESCLAASAEEWADYSDGDDDPGMAYSIAVELGADIPDHDCADRDACMCACATESRRPTRSRR